MRCAAIAALVMLLTVVGSAPASAAVTSRVIEGQYARLVSTGDPEAMRSMVPGAMAVWDVSVSADAPEPGTIAVALTRTGELPLRVDVRACDVAWSGAGCAAGEQSIASALTAPRDGWGTPLLEVAADDAAHLRLEVAVPADAALVAGTTTVLRVHADGYGDQLTATPPGSEHGTLPRTGMQVGGPLLLATGAVILGVAGSGLLAGRRRSGQRG